MSKMSAGILLYRIRGGSTEVFLIHPGGPFWKKKDLGAWSIPKGEPEEGEEPLSAARREFREETGLEVSGEFMELRPIRLASGKIVRAWAVEGDCDPDSVVSNIFVAEWPPRSGRLQEFPEVDRAGWFDADLAKKKINKAQADLIDELKEILSRIAGS